MKSIKFKLFLYLMVFIVAILGVFVLVTELFIDDYYNYINKSLMADIAKDYNDGTSSQDTMIYECQQKGIHAIVYDDEHNKIVTTGGIKNDLSEVFDMVLSSVDTEKTYSHFEIFTQAHRNSYVYILTATQEKYTVVMVKPIGLIRETITVANNFILFVAVLCVILAVFFVIIFANRFTKPIIEINSIADNIAHLDFTDKYTGSGNDEIHLLGENINKISDKLDSTIEELKDDIKQKEQVDKMRKEFVSNVSHEIKSPVGLITGYSQMMQDIYQDMDEQGKQYIETINEEALRIDNISSKLLLLADLDNNKSRINLVKVNLSESLSKIMSNRNNMLKDYDLKVAIAPNVFVTGDSTLLEMAIINLLDNAQKYTVNHTIEIELTNSFLRVTNPADDIPQDELDKIWTHFYKVNKSREIEDNSNSVGLGLSIVKTICNVHGFKCESITKDNIISFIINFD